MRKIPKYSCTGSTVTCCHVDDKGNQCLEVATVECSPGRDEDRYAFTYSCGKHAVAMRSEGGSAYPLTESEEVGNSIEFM